MAKIRNVYSCTSCGAQYPQWAGQCSECNAWNTLTETISSPKSPETKHPRFSGYAGDSLVQNLDEIEVDSEQRYTTRISELDRVLGGGLVKGSVVMIGGDPGIGKSTLLLQAMASVSENTPALYVTGEESPQQICLRAQRLGINSQQIRLLAETNVERIIKLAQNKSSSSSSRSKPQVIVIDSVQTIYTELLQSAPGNVAQLRESTAMLVRYAKQTGTSLLLVGHVTKEGTLAGPRVLEHMVDTVLYFEGDNTSQYRVLRATKNRFGTVNELGMFAMMEDGLHAVSNPSAIFLSRHDTSVPGSVITVTKEGSRPILVEVQSLVDESHLPNPRRVTVGLEQNRLTMLLAVLHRHGNIATYNQDVFVNVVGGMRISEPAADLPVLLSIISSMKNQPLAKGLAVFGEVGLAGEIRPIQNGQDRLREAAKHGFTTAIIPAANAPKEKIEGLKIIAVKRLSDAITQLS